MDRDMDAKLRGARSSLAAARKMLGDAYDMELVRDRRPGVLDQMEIVNEIICNALVTLDAVEHGDAYD